LNKFKLEDVNSFDAWNDFVSESPQGTIFSHTYYLELAVDKYKLFWVKKGSQIKAGIVLILNKKGNQVVLDDLVIHSGLMFAEDKIQKKSKKKSEQFEITEFVINYLDESYDSISFALSTKFEDLRPFLWHNYHIDNTNSKFSIDLRYTSRLDISELFLQKKDEDTSLFNDMDSKRQTDVQRALESGLKFFTSGDSDDLLSLYKLTMLNQSQMISDDKINRMGILIEGLKKKNSLYLFTVKNTNGLITYMTAFTVDNNFSYYLFGAGNPELMHRHDGTFCIWNAFKELSKLGVSNIDMEGINSPKRGWFKLSFGGVIEPYYHILKIL